MEGKLFVFKIETDVDQKIAYVYAPFNAIFNENIKNKYAAKWVMSKNAWCIKIEFVSDIREKMKEIFGRDKCTIKACFFVLELYQVFS